MVAVTQNDQRAAQNIWVHRKRTMKSCYDLFGIECGPGWIELYRPLMERCEQEGVTIMQIKEKLGGLRFYVGPCSDAMHEAISAAMNQSYTVCELCGHPGKLRTNEGWIQTLCDEHDAKLNKKQYKMTNNETYANRTQEKK